MLTPNGATMLDDVLATFGQPIAPTTDGVPTLMFDDAVECGAEIMRERMCYETTAEYVEAIGRCTASVRAWGTLSATEFGRMTGYPMRHELLADARAEAGLYYCSVCDALGHDTPECPEAY